MDLHGLISGPSPRSAGGDGKAPAPGPEGGARAFGEVVAGSRPQRIAPGGAGAAGAGSGDQPDPKPGQILVRMFEAADSPASSLRAGEHPTLPAGEIAAAAPDADPPEAGSDMPPGPPGESISDHDDAFDLPERRVPVEALAGAGTPALPGAEPRTTSREISLVPPTPAAGGQPARLAGSPARATPGVVATTTQASPGAPASPVPPERVSLGGNADAANPPPRPAGEGAALNPGAATAQSAGANAAVPVSPGVAGGAAGRDPEAAPPREPGATSLRMTGTAQAPSGDKARAPGTVPADPPPGIEPKPAKDLPGRMRAGGRGGLPAPAALPVSASPPPGGPPIGPEPGPMPVLPELPSAATRGRGPVVHDAVMQALGDSGRIGLAASSAATAQSPAGAAQALVAAHAGSAKIARAVAAQIATVIGSGPGSGRIELRLDPPELGTVEISLEITDQSLRATLAAERPATNELLRRHSEILLAQLQQAGFTGIDLQFAGNRAGDRGGAQPGITPRPETAGDPDAPPDDDHADLPAGRVARTTNGLDLRL